MYTNTNAYDYMKSQVIKDFPNLEQDGIEFLEFSYSGSVHPRKRDELSSMMTMQFVRGDAKNRIIDYTLNNENMFIKNNVDVSVGRLTNQTLSNTYETYQPFLFSEKAIDFTAIERAINQSIELFKKDANSETAFCSGFSIEKKEKPIMSVTISQRKFASTILRHYDWSIDGTKQLK